MSEKLKPCPFCGKDGLSVHRPGNNIDPFVWNTSCESPSCIAYRINFWDWKKENTIKRWNDAYCWKQLSRSEELNRELVEALEKTLASLVSYKHYVPEPYKQNPIYILGSVEAEQLAREVLKRVKEMGK